MKVIGRQIGGDEPGMLVALSIGEYEALQQLARAANGDTGFGWHPSPLDRPPVDIDLSGVLKTIREFSHNLNLLNQLQEQLKLTRESIETAFGLDRKQESVVNGLLNDDHPSGSTATKADNITVNKSVFMKP